MSEAEILRIFKSYDANGNGVISTDELRVVLEALRPALSQETVESLMSMASKTENGDIKYEEFIQWALSDGKMAIPELGKHVSTNQLSSAIIKAPAGAVFESFKRLNFKFLSTVQSAQMDEETGLINVAYTDNTVQNINELGYSYLDFKVSWEVVGSDPPAPTFSAEHTVQCYRSVDSINECFVTWNTEFSSDCTVQVLEDAKWKKVDAFTQLQAFLGRDPVEKPEGAGGTVPSTLAPVQYYSKVLPCKASDVFDAIKPLTFAWMQNVADAKRDEESGFISIAYQDDTIQKINQLEHHSVDRLVTWEVVDSEPAAATFSAVHTIVCHKVTTTDECFVTWNTNYSSDVTVEVLADSKWKKTKGLEELQEYLAQHGKVTSNEAHTAARTISRTISRTVA